MNLAQQLWIPLVRVVTKVAPVSASRFSSRARSKCSRPSGERLRDHRTDAPHRSSRRAPAAKDGARVAAQFLQQAVGRDRPDVGQGVQHQECCCSVRSVSIGEDHACGAQWTTSERIITANFAPFFCGLFLSIPTGIPAAVRTALHSAHISSSSLHGPRARSSRFGGAGAMRQMPIH